MTDEPKKTDEQPGDEWKMPEPVFRSSEGYRPGSPRIDPQEEIPTEPGFESEDSGEPAFGAQEDGQPPASEDEHPAQSVRASTKTRVRHKKKSGCAKTLGLIVGAVVLSMIAIVVALIYLAIFYVPAENSF